MEKKLFILLAGPLILGLMLGGHASAKSTPKGPEKILIGSPASLTGMFAGFGQGQSWGAKAAVEDINKQGGVFVKEFGRKVPLEITFPNTESNPQKAGALAEQMLAGKKVHFLVTGNEPPFMHSGPATVAMRYNFVHLAHVAVYEAWLAMRKSASPPWKNTWAFGFSIAAGAHERPGYSTLGTWLPVLKQIADKTNKRAAVFCTDDPDGRAWYSLFPKVLMDEGFTVSGFDKKLGLFPAETSDFSSMIVKWKNDNVDVLWGNSNAPNFGTMWKQAHTIGFKPKAVFISRAACNYIDVASWGGNLPHGLGIEVKWFPTFDTHGIGDTTPQSLLERWTEDTGQPLNDNIGLGYYVIQVLADAIERAGTLDTDAVNKALAETDLMTINARVKFDADQFNFIPMSFAQWQKATTPEKWELKLVSSVHNFVKTQAQYIFPIPYE